MYNIITPPLQRRPKLVKLGPHHSREKLLKKVSSDSGLQSYSLNVEASVNCTKDKTCLIVGSEKNRSN